MNSFRLDCDGRMVIGSVGLPVGLGNAIHTSWARRKLRSLYPVLEGHDFEYCWHGRIAMTKDRLPKILRLGPNAYSIFGFSGRGIGPGTVFGIKAAKSLLEGNESILPIQPIDKYSEGFTGSKSFGIEMGARVVHGLSLL